MSYENWADLELLTGLIFGEASGEPTAGKIAVAITAMTRAAHPSWWGKDLRSVILAPKQFSCWEDLNASKIVTARNQNSIVWNLCLSIARGVLSGALSDKIGKPTHYHTIAVTPKWSKSLTQLVTIGHHIFYHDPSIDKKKNIK